MPKYETFTLTEQHIKLLTNTVIDWNNCETGAPCIDPKRPYGNSDVTGDIRDLLGLKADRCPHCDEVIDQSEETELELERLHKETQTALQVVLHTKSFRVGEYERRPFDYSGSRWELVRENESK